MLTMGGGGDVAGRLLIPRSTSLSRLLARRGQRPEMRWTRDRREGRPGRVAAGSSVGVRGPRPEGGRAQRRVRCRWWSRRAPRRARRRAPSRPAGGAEPLAAPTARARRHARRAPGLPSYRVAAERRSPGAARVATTAPRRDEGAGGRLLVGANHVSQRPQRSQAARHEAARRVGDPDHGVLRGRALVGEHEPAPAVADEARAARGLARGLPRHLRCRPRARRGGVDHFDASASR